MYIYICIYIYIYRERERGGAIIRECKTTIKRIIKETDRQTVTDRHTASSQSGSRDRQADKHTDRQTGFDRRKQRKNDQPLKGSI